MSKTAKYLAPLMIAIFTGCATMPDKRVINVMTPEEKKQEIFEPFHQIDGSSTRRYGGIGLGLALAQKILAAHASKMNVESKIGLGSTFDFSLKRLLK